MKGRESRVQNMTIKKSVRFNNVVKVYEFKQDENNEIMSERSFQFAKLKLNYFVENVMIPNMKLNNK